MFSRSALVYVTARQNVTDLALGWRVVVTIKGNFAPLIEAKELAMIRSFVYPALCAP